MEEFYVGYQSHAPKQLGHFLRRLAAALLVLVFLVAGGLVLAQGEFAKSYFGFGVLENFEGTIDGAWLITGDNTALALVGEGKRGVTFTRHCRVKVTGQRIERDGIVMVEVASITPVEGAVVNPTETDLGAVTLTGEIVDTKCFLGVMNPGAGKLHKDCARNCLRGGIPAGLVAGGKLYFLEGGDFADRVGLRVTLKGRAVQRAGRLILRAE